MSFLDAGVAPPSGLTERPRTRKRLPMDFFLARLQWASTLLGVPMNELRRRAGVAAERHRWKTGVPETYAEKFLGVLGLTWAEFTGPSGAYVSTLRRRRMEEKKDHA